MALSRDDVRRLAIAGARTRLQELDAERRALMTEFPEFGSSRAGATSGGFKPVRKRVLTAAQRRAISKRMTALWAERRKAKAKTARTA